MNQLIFLLLSSLLPLLSSAQFTPTDSILINCGSPTATTDADGRQWQGDDTSKSFLTSGSSQNGKAQYQDPSLASPVPLMTAAFFTSEATYKFPLSKDHRHFLRLHFYPTRYIAAAAASPNISTAYFDVTASPGLTLMRNFSAYDACRSLIEAYLIKEFALLPSPDGVLTLTFTPSKHHQGSYAFVNGIEIISMPNIFIDPVPLVGGEESSATIDVPALNIQTMYRLNVGGNYLTPANDSGLGRYWYDDTPYISAPPIGVTFGASIGLTYTVPSTDQIQYAKNEKATFAAPEGVYRTYRSMGVDNNLNLLYNLSWAFPVDANFTYIVRLHLCENEMTMANQRVFDVLIDGQMAQRGADVIAWSSERMVPVYRDFAVYANNEEEEEEGGDMLWVSLKPNDESGAMYYDSILNGLEIFKVSDSNGSFAGANLVP